MIGEILGGAAAIGQAVQQGGPKRQYKWNKKAMQDANTMNRENQQWILQQQKLLQEEQREYDSPEAQMARYKAAGLNPHLIYGSGTSAGQAFPIDAGNIAPARLDAPTASYPDVMGAFIRASQAASQIGLNTAREGQVEADTALKSLQTDIAKTNPMLSPWVQEWVSTSMAEVARLKTMEARSWMSSNDDVMKITKRINAEVEALTQRLGLNTLDLKIKNQILESKEFENAIKEIQTKWLKDGDLTPEHIRQGLMLLLSKMVGR